MARFHLATKREAVNMALRHLAGEPLGLDEARALKGSGWGADLVEDGWCLSAGCFPREMGGSEPETTGTAAERFQRTMEGLYPRMPVDRRCSVNG